MKKIQEKIEECVSIICSKLEDNQELLGHIADNLLKISDFESSDAALDKIFGDAPYLKSTDNLETADAISELAYLLNATEHKLVKDEVARKVKSGTKTVDAMIDIVDEVKDSMVQIFKQHKISLLTKSSKINEDKDSQKRKHSLLSPSINYVEKVEKERIVKRCSAKQP